MKTAFQAIPMLFTLIALAAPAHTSAATKKKSGAAASAGPVIESDPDHLAPTVKLLAYSELGTGRYPGIWVPKPGGKLPSPKAAGAVKVLRITYPVKVEGSGPGQWPWPKLRGIGKLAAVFDAADQEPGQPLAPHAVDFGKLKGMIISSQKDNSFIGYLPTSSGTCSVLWVIPAATDVVEVSLPPATPITIRLRPGTATPVSGDQAPFDAPAADGEKPAAGQAAPAASKESADGVKTESPIFERLRAQQQAKRQTGGATSQSPINPESIYERTVGAPSGSIKPAAVAPESPTPAAVPAASGESPISMAQLERRYGTNAKIAEGLQSKTGEKFDIIFWEDDPKLLRTAIRKDGVIDSIGIERKPTAQGFGGGIGSFASFDYSPLDRDALFHAFADGHQWAYLGAAKGVLGSEEVFQRSDGALYGLASPNSVSVCIPQSFKRSHPDFKPDKGREPVSLAPSTEAVKSSTATTPTKSALPSAPPEQAGGSEKGGSAVSNPTPADKVVMPAFKGELSGGMEVRVRNPNDFSVKVGLRSGGKGKDFTVGASGVKSVYVPNGSYDIYFQYSTDPDGLYQGDSFTLSNNGVEIKIVKVVDGNYGIRKVR